MDNQRVSIWSNKTGWLKSEEEYVEEITKETVQKEKVLPDRKTSWRTYPIALSAKSEDALYEKICDLKKWINKEGKNQTLGNISYTLLACRSHFNIRCAMLVKSLDELEEYLQILCDTHKQSQVSLVQRIYKNGHVKGEELKRLTREVNVISSGSYYNEDEEYHMKNMMVYYVKGADIPFKELFASTSYRKTAMPVYPFSRDVYCISDGLDMEDTTEEKKYPMFDSIEYENDEIVCKKVLSRNDFYIREHQVGNEMVLPGVAYLEMARSALETAKPQITVNYISEVYWLNPIRLKVMSDQYEVYIRLIKSGESEYQFQITSYKEELQLVHGYGSLICNQELEVQEKVDVEYLKSRCTNELSSSDCYEQLEKHGLMLGHAFHTIHSLAGNRKEAVSSLLLPAELSSDFDSYVLHPSLLDGALETVSCLFYDNYGNKASASLPYSVKQVTIYQSIPEECYAYTKESEVQVENAVCYDVLIIGKDGKVCVQVNGFALIHQTEENKLEEALYYRPVWKNVELENICTLPEQIILIDAEKSLLQAFKRDGKNVIEVVRNSDFSQKDNRYQLDIMKQEHFEKLFDVLGRKEDMGILFQTKIAEDGFENQEQYFQPILALARAICAKGLRNVRFLNLTNQLFHPVNQAITSLLQTIHLEYKSFQGKNLAIDLMPENIVGICSTILRDEVPAVCCRYMDGTLSGLTYEEIQTKQEPFEPKTGEVYLVTGGAGGLGYQVAQLFVKKSASVIMTGRSRESAEIRNKVTELNREAGSAEYIASDISSQQDVKDLIQYIKNKYGKIDGIIHAAGVNRDSFIWNKQMEEVKDVFAAKIRGTILLDEMTKDEKMKLFVCFSSIAAVGGCIGQSDYSFANGFMDGYMQHRRALAEKENRSGQSYSINWSLWEDGGMQVDKETKDYFREGMGVTPLSGKTGMNAFMNIINGKETQVVCICGDREKIAGNICMEMKKNTASMTEQSDESIRSFIMEQTTQSMMDILKLRRKDIKGDTELADYGFNSLTFTSLSNDLNQRFEINTFTPASFFELDTVNAICDMLMKQDTSQIQRKMNRNKKSNIEPAPIKKEQKIVMSQPAVKKEQKDAVNVSYQAVHTQSMEQEPIAVIGISGVMPQSENLDEFWNHIKEQDDLITEIPKDRWDWKTYYSEDGVKENTTYSKWGGFMKQVDQFDCRFFGISPKEAELMDPQQRIYMETIYKTIDNAGYKPSDFSGTKTGMFVGVSTMDYYNIMKEAGMPMEAHTSTGISHCVLANRISYLLDIHGPSEPIDTACSSSLIAIHRAVESIHNGDCEMAFAGGVNVILSPMLHIAFGKAGMLSKDGRCKTFDTSADGYVRGEGAGAILLKPLSKAKQDKDHIYAVIKSTAVNHGGKANTLTSPNPNAQAELLYKAYTKAGIHPDEVSYIEAHGTGTSLGDPIEINGLKKAYQMLKDSSRESSNVVNPRCEIGTVKTNIGHLEAAAGIAGILKVILSMEHKTIPGIVHLNHLNPYIKLDGTPFHIIDRTSEWKAPRNAQGEELPRIAGVSSFGFGGANAHIVLEEYTGNNDSNISFEQNLFVLSAKKQESLRLQAKELLDYLQNRVVEEKRPVNVDKAGVQDSRRVLECISRQLSVPVNDIDVFDSLSDYGMDVIQLEKLSDEINREFDTEISCDDLRGQKNVNDIVTMILQREGVKEKGIQADMEGSQEWLSSVAYTLQKGRQAYQERLCILASSLTKLISKLEAYIADKEEAGIYTGSAKELEEKLGSFFDGEVGSRYISDLIKEKNWEKLAQLYVMGFDIEWNLLYEDGIPQRVALPGYIFQNKRVWFRKEDRAEMPKTLDLKDFDRTEPIKKNKSGEAKSNAVDWEQIMADADDSVVTLEMADTNIALIRMQDRQNRNMFSNNLIGGLMKRFKELKGRDDVKAIIVTGYENVFSMGGTQEQLHGIASANSHFTDIPFLYSGLLKADVPVISVIQGHATGGGFLFGLYGDIVMLSEESVYSAVFMKYGFTPGMGATCILPEKLGGNIANEMMYTAKTYTGAELKEKGASVMVMKRDEMMQKAISIGRIIAEKPVNSLRVLKKELAGRMLEKLEAVLESENCMHMQTFQDPDVKKKIDKYYSSTLGNPDRKEEKQDKKNTEKPKPLNERTKRKLLIKIVKDMKEQFISPEEAVKIVHKIMGVTREGKGENMNERSYYEQILNENIDEEVAVDMMLKLLQEEESANSEKKVKKPEIKEEVREYREQERKVSKTEKPCISKEVLKEKLEQIFDEILHLEGDYEEDMTFSDMGVDSINGVEIVRDINRAFDLNIDTVVLYDHSSMDALTAYLYEKIQKENHDFFV